MRKVTFALAITWPGALWAHGIGTTVGYQQTLGSMVDSVYAPVILLLLVPLSLMAGTGGMDGSKRALAAFSIGLVVGFPLAASLGVYGAVGGLCFGMLCALQAAASLPLPKAVPALLAAGAGIAATIYNLQGHPLGSLPFAVHLGVFLGPMLAATALTGWIGMILQVASQSWLKILFRILASWSFAANAIYLAFQLKSGS